MINETTRVVLWQLEKTDKAILFSKAYDQTADRVWIPRSVIHHISREPNGRCIVDLELWFADKNGI